MKSLPRKTPSTPSISNNLDASGEFSESSFFLKSAVPDFITSLPGKNLIVRGFGVSSV